MVQSSTPSTNPLLEVEIPLGGTTYRVRPQYRILARIEFVTGDSVRELGLRCYAAALPLQQRPQNVKEIKLAEVANILGLMLADIPAAPKAEQIGELLVEEGGFMDLLQPMGDFLTRSVRGNKEYERDMRERAEAAAAEQKVGDADTAAENPPMATAAE